jgi:O-antigen ligase
LEIHLLQELKCSITVSEWIKPTPQFDHLSRHFLFLTFAPLLLGHVRLTLVFGLMAILSVLISPWTMGAGWSEVAQGWSGQRVGFGIHNEQHTALVFGAAFLGWLILGPRIWFAQNRWRVLLALTWVGISFCLLTGMMMAQTRAAYLALAFLMLMGVFAFIFWAFNKAPNRHETGWLNTSWRSWYVLAAICLVWMLAMTAMALSDFLTLRFGESSLKWANIVLGRWNSLTQDNLGLRIHSWQAAYEWFLNYPVLGLGRNGAQIVLQNTEWLQSLRLVKFGHMHNSAIDIVIRYGLVGLSVYVALLGWTTVAAHRAWRAGVMPTDFYVFYYAFFFFFLIMNMFESYMFYPTGIWVFTIVMSSLMGFIWKNISQGRHES